MDLILRLFQIVSILLPLLVYTEQSVIFEKSHGFDIVLDTIPSYRGEGWKFPKDRPYKYFNFTHDIPHDFLPVHVNSLPEAEGIWVIRHKDFTGAPRTFTGNRAKDTSKSVINYGAHSQQFWNVTIKALAFGQVQLDLVVQSSTNLKEVVSQKVSLFGENVAENCTDDSSNEHKRGLRWSVFEIHNAPASKLSLETRIHHSKSFLILDQISMYTTSFLNFNNAIRTDGNNYLDVIQECNKITRCQRIL